MSDLFRPEAIEHATRRLGGKVALTAAPSIWVCTFLFLTIILGGAFFAAQASYARKESVVGWLVPEGGIVRAAAPNGGTVTEILVKEGDLVEPGQPIAFIGLAATTVDGNVGSSIASNLETQARASESRTQAALRQLEANAARLRSQRKGLNAELGQLREQIRLQQNRVEILKVSAQRAEEAAGEGLLTWAEAEAQTLAYMDAQLSLSGLERSATLLMNRMSDLTEQIEAIPIDKELMLAEAEAASAELAERTTQTMSMNEYVVTSPIEGRIDAMLVRLGQNLSPGTTIAAVSPHYNDLFAELFVPSRAAGFIKPAQDVNIKYHAFPYQRFGMGEATIETISLTVLAPSEVFMPDLQVNEPVFRVLARLNQKDIEAYGTSIPLRSGMMLSADIIIDQRTLAEWVLDPLYAAGRR